MPSLNEDATTTPMPIGGPGSTHQESGMDVLKRRALRVFGFVVGFFIIRNLFFKDYTTETKSFLTSTGHADAIERVVPKTQYELMQDQLTAEMIFKQLQQNMTTVMGQYNDLKRDVEQMKQQINSGNSTSSSISSTKRTSRLRQRK